MDMKGPSSSSNTCDITMDEDLFIHWCHVGVAEGLKNDTQVAEFLVKLYDHTKNGVQSSVCCHHCQAHLTLFCAPCGAAPIRQSPSGVCVTIDGYPVLTLPEQTAFPPCSTSDAHKEQTQHVSFDSNCIPVSKPDYLFPGSVSTGDRGDLKNANKHWKDTVAHETMKSSSKTAEKASVWCDDSGDFLPQLSSLLSPDGLDADNVEHMAPDMDSVSKGNLGIIRQQKKDSPFPKQSGGIVAQSTPAFKGKTEEHNETITKNQSQFTSGALPVPSTSTFLHNQTSSSEKSDVQEADVILHRVSGRNLITASNHCGVSEQQLASEKQEKVKTETKMLQKHGRGRPRKNPITMTTDECGKFEQLVTSGKEEKAEAGENMQQKHGKGRPRKNPITMTTDKCGNCVQLLTAGKEETAEAGEKMRQKRGRGCTRKNAITKTGNFEQLLALGKQEEAESGENMQQKRRRGRPRKNLHTLIPKVKKPFKCRICGEGFEQSSQLYTHTKSNNMPFKCSECARGFQTEKCHNIHRLSHRPDNDPCDCSQCGKHFQNKRQLIPHLKRHKRHEVFVCHTCGEVFPAQRKLDQHLKKHDESSSLKQRMPVSPMCECCGETFKTMYNLHRHRTRHSTMRYACSICNATLKSKDGLKKHLFKHRGERPYVCTECGKAFGEHGHLNFHMRVHTREKPYVCQVCSKAFGYKQSLTHHVQRLHTAERPYKCEFCPLATITSHDLAIHRRTHTGEKPYSCTVCGATFARRDYWRKHIVIHTGDKLFACSECGVEFRNVTGLQRHIKTHA